MPSVGIGGPHIGLNYIWPMSIMMHALTSQDDTEILKALDMLKARLRILCAAFAFAFFPVVLLLWLAFALLDLRCCKVATRFFQAFVDDLF